MRMVMNFRRRFRLTDSLRAATVLLAAATLLRCAPAQAPVTAACKADPKSSACTAPSAPPKSTADENPFPTEDSKHGANAEGDPGSLPPASGAKPSNPNGLPEMPVDGNVPDPPASSQRPMHLPPSGIGGLPGDSSSSPDAPTAASSSSHDDDDDDVAPTTASPNAPVKAAKLKDLGSSGSFSAAHEKLEATRLQDDLKVGKFYLQDNNPQGAYLRYKDAVAHDPDEPDAHFGMAEAADQLKKREEAVAQYRETLRLDPGGDHDKAARHALQRLGAAAQ